MKKFLLITYYWPPCGGVSVQRWLKLTKYFPMFDWLPTVITTENGDYPYIDKSLLKKISPEVRVIRTKTPTFKQLFNYLLGKEEKIPYGSLQISENDSFLKKMIFLIRTQFVIPDARVIWNQYAIKAAEKTIMSGMYEVVITTGPPHSTHLIGLKLKKKYGIKWIADFRDPWTKIYYLESEKRNIIIKYFDKLMEKRVIAKADAVVTVSENVANVLSNRDKMIIPNAFDPDDYYDKNYIRSEKFRIKFVGALTDSRKKEVLRTLFWFDDYAEKNGVTNIEFSFIGAFEKNPTDIQKKLPHIKIRNLPFVKHEKVIEECINSETLLLVINISANNKGILTYKLFEYIGSKTYILGIGPDDSDVQKILNQLNAGTLLHYNSKDKFLEIFDNLYQKWASGKSVKNISDINEFSLPSICSQYSDLLKSITR